VTKDEVEDIKRHFDVVAEGLGGDIRQVGEGVVLANDRLGHVEQRLDGVDHRLERVEIRLDGVDHRLERVEIRLDGVENRLDGFEQEVRTEFAEVKSMIKLSFAELDRRITTLETTVHDLTTRLERLEAHIS
jgi:chromosome segregation ATPase